MTWFLSCGGICNVSALFYVLLKLFLRDKNIEQTTKVTCFALVLKRFEAVMGL